MEFQEGKHLTFLLGREEYAIPISRVKEIIGMMDITTIPRTPPFIKGIINLRGKVIPIIDLRLKFGLEEIAYTERTCIVILEVNSLTRGKMMGIAVDAVSEVVLIQKNEVEDAPLDDGYVDGRFLAGIGKVKDRVLLLLDVEQILAHEEAAILEPKEVTDAV